MASGPCGQMFPVVFVTPRVPVFPKPVSSRSLYILCVRIYSIPWKVLRTVSHTVRCSPYYSSTVHTVVMSRTLYTVVGVLGEIVRSNATDAERIPIHVATYLTTTTDSGVVSDGKW